MNVLLIDDARAHRLVTQRALQDLGFSVTEAETADEGLGRLKRATKFDLILADWEMTEMDGLKFIQLVRAEPKYHDTPLILLGTTQMFDRLSEALEAGANEYIMKPFTKEVLEMKLELLGIEATKS